MIITCNNCNKRFDIDANLIPDKGRLLQCASCDHKWFFKKETLENIVSPIIEDINNDNVLDQDNPINNKEINPSNLSKEETEVDIEDELDEKIKVNNEEAPNKKIKVNNDEAPNKKIKVNNDEAPNKKIDANIDENTTVNAKLKKKNVKILNIFVVVIISFVAFIIIVDTFKYPIGQVVPNIEFILYNLYESIKDISLFIRDLT